MSASTPAAMAADRAQDPRVQRTQAALRTAFNRLFLEHGYDPITPAHIAAEAGVGRSTFYDHYTGNAALLRQTVSIILGPLADAAVGRDTGSLDRVMCHLWDNRRFARRIITGRPAIIVRRRLIELIELALRSEGVDALLPLPLIAADIAASQLALIEAWLTGRFACTAKQLTLAFTAEGKRFSAVSVAS